MTAVKWEERDQQPLSSQDKIDVTLYFIEAGSHTAQTALRCVIKDGLELRILPPLPHKSWDHRDARSDCFMWCWDSDPGLHASKASILTTE